MKPAFALLLLCPLVGPALADDCDCTSYPFMPNPPCYGTCISRLSAGNLSITKVRNMDPAVANAIAKLQKQDRSAVDFGAIRDKDKLEQAVHTNSLPWLGDPAAGAVTAAEAAAADSAAAAAAAADSAAEAAEAAKEVPASREPAR